LTLVQQDGSYEPQTGQAQPEYIQGKTPRCFPGLDSRDSSLTQLHFYTVTLPDGVTAGQTIHVQAPDGRLNAIVIPPGFGPGSTFTVEFAPPEAALPEAVPASSAATAPTAAPVGPPPPVNHHTDDGFASGFNNPGYVPQAQAYPSKY
jgi:hypothetical protein